MTKTGFKVLDKSHKCNKLYMVDGRPMCAFAGINRIALASSIFDGDGSNQTCANSLTSGSSQTLHTTMRDILVLCNDHHSWSFLTEIWTVKLKQVHKYSQM